jgi:hypothetical protein
MAEEITHVFISAKSDSPDTTLVSSSEWNDGHVFGGGINGQHLIYDNTQPNNVRWTNGIVSGENTANITGTSPVTAAAPVIITVNGPAFVIFTLRIDSYAATGNATGTFQPTVAGVPVDTVVVVSPQTVIIAVPRTTVIAAGAHTFAVNIATAGNVNITAGSIRFGVIAIGI